MHGSKMAGLIQRSRRGSSNTSTDRRSHSMSEDWENEDDSKKNKTNPFDSDSEDLVFDGDWTVMGVNSFDVKASRDFCSRTKSFKGDDDEEELGSPWGGVEYSIQGSRPKSDSTSSASARSARFRLNSFSQKDRPSSEVITRGEEASCKKTPAPNPPQVQTKIPPPKPPPPVNQNATNSNMSITDVVTSAPQISSTEYNRMQNELAQLKRKLEYLQRDKWKTPPLDETLKRLVQGEPYVLEPYRSLSDKLELLNKTIKMHDGNAIIAVLLFLKRTLKQNTFSRELISRPAAVRQYTQFLQSHQDYEELTKLYSLLGKTEELTMMQYRRALANKDPDTKLNKLREIHKTFKQRSDVTEFSNCVQEHANLLEKQISLEARDKALEAEGKDVLLRNHPRAAPVLNMPLITTLFYCAYYHYGKEEDLTDVHKIKKEFKLTDKQFEWITISARSRMKRWRDIEELLTSKGWFGAQKLKSYTGFHNIVDMISKSGAPQNVISKYLVLVDDNQTRLNLASKLQCHDVAIDTCMAMKDKRQLEEYRNKVKSQIYQQKINDLLRNSQIKWKS